METVGELPSIIRQSRLFSIRQRTLFVCTFGRTQTCILLIAHFSRTIDCATKVDVSVKVLVPQAAHYLSTCQLNDLAHGYCVYAVSFLYYCNSYRLLSFQIHSYQYPAYCTNDEN